MSERCNETDVGVMGNYSSAGGGSMNKVIVHELAAVLLRRWNIYLS